VSATTALPPDVDAYLAAVRAALTDLPAAERDDLVAEVEVSLLDAASEGGPIAARLGPPEEFAAELRSAAGLDTPAVPAEPRDGFAARAWRRASTWWSGERGRAVRRVLVELAPIWWIVRGYVAVAALAMASDASWTSPYPSIPRLGDGQGGLGVVALGIVLSVLLGLATRRRASLRPVSALANAVLLIAALPVAGHVADGAQAQPIVYVETPAAAAPGLVLDGVPVDNVYPYTRDGALLHDVQLFDGSGRPLDVRRDVDEPDRRVPASVTGTLLWNVFPIRYFEPGTNVVADPNAAPPLSAPKLKTPSLESGSTP